MQRNTKNRTLEKRNTTPPTLDGLDLIPVDVYAPRIGWHPESLRRACREGRLCAVKVGREWRIPRGEAARIEAEGIRS